MKKKDAKTSEGTGEEEAILAHKNLAEAEIETLCNATENREKLKAEISAVEKEIITKAKSLTQKRTIAAEKLGQLIGATLARLGMPNSNFKAAIVQKAQGGQISLGPWGAEDVDFLISANKGEPLKDLSRVASGGELSRVMLAIKTALLSAEKQENLESIETLVFDEVDTGIGGEVALAVGEYLAQIGKIKQIFCVTHLASIAVRADNHFKVEKRTEGGRTYTGVGPMSMEGRKKEIARMLAGDAGDAAIAHAEELMRKYGNSN
jgi:DNA repair protein RecN (Recombination protein N)